MWSETVYVKLKEEGVNSLNMINMRFILLNMQIVACSTSLIIYIIHKKNVQFWDQNN